MRGGYRRGKALKPVIVAGTPSIYLLRDQFLTDYAAGDLDETVSEPIVGIRLVTDAEGKLFITGDRLRGGGQDTPVWGQSKMVWVNTQYGGFARATGRALVGLILPEDTIVDADIAFGWASAVNIGDPRTDGLGFLTENGGELDAIVPGIKIKPRIDDQYNVRPMQYLVVIALNDVGAVWMISTFGTATSAIKMSAPDIPQYPLASIFWVDRSDITAILFPYVQYYGKIMGPAAGYPNGNSLEDVRVFDVSAWSTPDALAAFSDRFTRADNPTAVGNGWAADATGTWGIIGGKAYYAAWIAGNRHYVIHDSGLANGNGFFTWDYTYPTAGVGNFELYFRYIDTNNWYVINNDNGNNVNLSRTIAGVYTQDFLTAPLVWAAGQTYHFTLFINGDWIVLAVDNVIKWNTHGATLGFLTTATKFGFGEWFTPKVGERWDNIAAYPLQTALPAVFDLGKIPTILTGGMIIAQDHFTGINGTLLSAHTPDVGPAWAHPVTNWTIQANKGDPALDLALPTFCVQDLGVTDAECQVTITLAVGCDRAFPGIVGRYVDSTHYIGARICWANYAPTAHEVELHYNKGSGGDVYHKINLDTYYVQGTTHTLKMQFKGDLIQVFLDGEPIISYYTESTSPMGTKFGLNEDYLTRSQEGHVFEDWIVRSL